MPEKRGTTGAVHLFIRAVGLRCPRCGARSLFRTWLTMHEQCYACRLRFEREQGYFLGAMYINYGVTVGLALIGSFALEWSMPVSLTQQLLLWVGFCGLFPVVFFRYSRSLWLGLDYLCDPSVAESSEAEEDHEAW